MTDERFEQCLPYILKEEGGNDDDPNDHGGRTSRGITQREYDKYRSAKQLATRDVWTADDAEVKDIYYVGYWLPRCPKLHPGVDLIYFNICVNGGPGRAERILLASVGDHGDAVTLDKFDAAVVAFYRGLSQFPRYGRGWLGREARIYAAAKTMLVPETQLQPAPAPIEVSTEPPASQPQPQEIPMPPPSTTGTAAPAVDRLPGVDFAEIKRYVETSVYILPMIANFFPPLRKVLPFIPVLEEVLDIADQLDHAATNDDIIRIVSDGLHRAGDRLKAGVPT